MVLDFTNMPKNKQQFDDFEQEEEIIKEQGVMMKRLKLIFKQFLCAVVYIPNSEECFAKHYAQ